MREADRLLTRALREAGQKRLSERAKEGEFGVDSVHTHPLVALQNALQVRAVSDTRAEALLVRVRRGEFG